MKNGYQFGGGAIYKENGDLTIIKSSINENRTSQDGAICLREGEIEIHDGIFRNNGANGYDGESGTLNASRCKFTIGGGEFQDNAAGYGGAISLFDCDDDINAKFYGNEARRGNVIEDFPRPGTDMNNSEEEL